MVSATDPHGHILDFLYWSQYCLFQVASQLYSRGSVDPVPDFSENLVVPGIEPRPLDLQPENRHSGFLQNIGTYLPTTLQNTITFM
jgi:hypothetical protein